MAGVGGGAIEEGREDVGGLVRGAGEELAPCLKGQALKIWATESTCAAAAATAAAIPAIAAISAAVSPSGWRAQRQCYEVATIESGKGQGQEHAERRKSTLQKRWGKKGT